MTRSVATRLHASFVVYFGLILALGLSCSWVLQRQHDDGLVVNLSGRQRMLTQRMTHQLLYYASLVRDARPSIEARNAVLGTMRVFETTLTALDQGGSAPLDLQMTSMRALPAGSREVRQQIVRVRNVWSSFRLQARAILDMDASARDAAIERLVTNNTELLAEMDAVVVLMQREAEAKVEVLSMIQRGAMALGLLITVVLVWFVHWSITIPLKELALASREMSLGNLHREVPCDGPAEIANIGQSFERLRLSLRTVMAAQNRSPMMDAMDRELMSMQS